MCSRLSGSRGEVCFVLKWRFYCYLGMGRPADQETIVTEKVVCDISLCLVAQATGEAPDRAGGEGARGEPG